MKKFYLITALAMATLVANAQQKLNLSTYLGTDVTNLDGKTCEVRATRAVFKGWNTLSLPFAMSEQELNATFGEDCKLERLIGVEESADGIQLNFQDCKHGGVQPNTPYILHYSGETGNVKIEKSALMANAASVLSFTTPAGEVVTMCGAAKHTDGQGLYGVLAVDNSEARFVKVGTDTRGFYATRCFIRLSSGADKQLTTHHVTRGEVTTIKAVATDNEKVDVYSVNGTRVASQIRASQVSSLKPGLYVVKGEKILVK